jgi:apolipoprotein N-acyltransferase
VRNTLSYSWDVSAPRAAPFGVPLALIFGALTGFMHVPFAFSWLVALPLAGLLFVSAREATPRLAARVAFFGWLAFWAVHIFWLPQSFAPSFGPLVWVLMPLVWVIEAGFNAILVWVAHRLTRSAIGFLGFMAGGIVILEWMRGLGPLAFPWGNFGYALVDSPLAQVSSLGGVYLGSLVVTMLASGLAALVWLEFRGLIVSAVVIALGVGYGVTRPAPPTPTRTAWLMQGNIDSFRRFLGSNKTDLQVYTNLLRGAPRDAVVVLPEAALGIHEVANVAPFPNSQPLPANLRLPNISRLLAGVSDLRQGARLNSVAAISNSRLLSKTDKTRLVPFGEFYPLRQELRFIYDPILSLMGLTGLTSADAGRDQRLLELNGERFGAFVCYDSIFPDLPRSLVRRGAQVLVEPTNDGWFGGGNGNLQHFAMDRIRAIETGRYLLRTANTGITAGIDPLGRVLNSIPMNREGALLTRYEPLEGQTVYVIIGEWALFAAGAISLGFAIVSRGRVRW